MSDPADPAESEPARSEPAQSERAQSERGQSEPARSEPAELSNPLTRTTPLGGRTGVAVVSVLPIVCVVVFLVLGFLGNWAWSWIILLAIPLSYLIVYGVRGRSRR
jgi:hypothetical protein